ncbi:hypothetical protein [Polymorphobacter sp.]|uniref:hypothetical protein n=1 Tax=Polymorphobacter sp. TaxID=1909290 RepID=UPI003F6F1A6B
MSALTEPQQRILDQLVAAQGNWVPGRTLAKTGAIPFEWLSNHMKVIRTHRPDLLIYGQSGRGYRAEHTTAAAVTPVKERPRGLEPTHVTFAKTRAVLDLLPAGAASMVKEVALESGEPVQDVLHRLISYGIEVHNDLVRHGENPLALRRVS